MSFFGGEIGQPAGGFPARLQRKVLTFEAMKTETAVRAERDGRVAEVLVRPGEQIDAKDLLLILD